MSLEIDNIPDVSQWQGDIDWTQVPAPIALIKMSDGSGYLDPKANHNYYGAKAAGKAVGMYHFAEWTDPTAEANEFIKAVSPLEEGDVLILDVEAIKIPNPVDWVVTWTNRVHDATGVWPLVYMNLSTLNSFNWSPVLNNSGLWLADWAVSPHDNIPTNHVYVMQQYTDAGSIAGIQGRVDEDAWFGTVEQFTAYGYHKAQPTPQPQPTSTPTPDPVTPPAPDPVTPPVQETPPVAPVDTPPVVQPPVTLPTTSGEAPAPVQVITGPSPAAPSKTSAILKVAAAIAILVAALLAWLHN